MTQPADNHPDQTRPGKKTTKPRKPRPKPKPKQGGAHVQGDRPGAGTGPAGAGRSATAGAQAARPERAGAACDQDRSAPDAPLTSKDAA